MHPEKNIDQRQQGGKKNPQNQKLFHTTMKRNL